MTDDKLLETYDRRLKPVRDFTRGVAEGYQTGLYVWGEAGISKTFTVKDTLEKLDAGFLLLNSRITAKGLFHALRSAPDMIFVLEDCEKLCKEPDGANLLRAALAVTNTKPEDNGRHPERLVTWYTADEAERVTFTGGIIFTMNRPLDKHPELVALKTRIPHLHLCPTEDEKAAKMREIASHGYRMDEDCLSPDEAREVCEFVICGLKKFGKPLNFRTLTDAFRDRLQWRAGLAELDWSEMVTARLHERTYISRAQRVADETRIAREIDSQDLSHTEKLALWKERTHGKSQAAYYRRLND